MKPTFALCFMKHIVDGMQRFSEDLEGQCDPPHTHWGGGAT